MTGSLKGQTVLELACIRVNAISPGAIDSGAWDALVEQGKVDYFADMTARNPGLPWQQGPRASRGVDRDLTLDEATPGGPL